MSAAKNPLVLRESRFVQLLYSHAVGVVVAEFERDYDQHRQRSLYVRDESTHKYERIAAADDRTSHESPVVCRSAPLVFFNVTRQSDRGGSWLHVARADIITRQIEVVVSPTELAHLTKADPRWPMQPWVSGLVDISDDGAVLTCNIGVPEPGEGGGFGMTYGLYSFELAHRRLTRLVVLEQTPWW